MNIEYIIVQAGGKGTRMEYLTANKPKALVPIDNLPMIFHLFKKYPNKKYLIISDYKIDVLRKYLASFAKVQYIIIDAQRKKGTCSGIREALKRIPDEKPFMLIWSDLILRDNFEIPDNIDDYVGLVRNFRCRWRYENDLFEEIPSEENGVAGLFLFKNKQKLMDVPDEGELVRWMKQKNQRYSMMNIDNIKEYGTYSEWKESTQKNIDNKCRPFNKIVIEDEVVIKVGIDEQGLALASHEKAWYKTVIKAGYKHVPQIYQYEPLQMQRIQGKKISENKLTYSEKKLILKRIVEYLQELHNLSQIATDYFSVYHTYIGKTLDRLGRVREMIPFGNQEYIVVNGRTCRNIFFFTELLEEYFSDYSVSSFKLIHGDSTFSNIMLNEKFEPVFIDPRGYFGYTELFGDSAYDWAKLYYSIIGNYDQFNKGKFKLEINDDNVELEIESNGWEDMEGDFFKLIGDEATKKNIKIIHGVVWLSLTTYAWEDYDSICGAFYNGIYYLEEVL